MKTLRSCGYLPKSLGFITTTLLCCCAQDFAYADVVDCFGELVETGAPDLDPVLAVLNVQTPGDLEDSYEQMSPILFNNIAFAQENIAEQIRVNYSKHFIDNLSTKCQDKSVVNFWVIPFLAGARQHTSSALTGYKEVFAGFSGTFDFRGKAWMISLGGSYVGGNVKVPHKHVYADLVTYSGNLGLSWVGAGWFFDLQGAYQYNPTYGKRRMHFSAPQSGVPVDNVKARHHNHSNAWLAHIGLSYLWEMRSYKTSSMYIYPFGNADYLTLSMSHYREHGAGSLDLRVSGEVFDLFRSEGGLGFMYHTCFQKWDFMCDVAASYIHESRDLGQSSRASFVPVHCSFRTKGIAPENNLISPDVRFRFRLGEKRIFITIGYHGEYGEHFDLSSGDLEFKWNF